MNSKQLVTVEDPLIYLKEGRLCFPPLQVGKGETKATPSADNKTIKSENLLPLSRGDRTYRFGIETRRLWTPKAVSEAAEKARRNADVAGIYPLILVPYLSEEQLLVLEAKGVSGLDLCGNGVVVVPDELLVLRTGFPNRFRWETAIKNVYRKNSSIVSRAFLLIPRFSSLKEAQELIRKRGGEVTLGTISKVCKSLEADLVIERSHGETPAARLPAPPQPGGVSQPPRARPSPCQRRLSLLQPDKLLDLLANNYAPPVVGRRFRGNGR